MAGRTLFVPVVLTLALVALAALGATIPMAEAPAPPAFVAHIRDVLDGDSLVGAVSGREVEMRLFDVNCPEYDTPDGEKAKQGTSRAVLGRKVWVFPTGRRAKDAYGRLLVRIWTNENGWLSDRLLREGLARRYTDPDNPSRGFEDPAKWPTRPPPPLPPGTPPPDPTVYVTPSGTKYHTAVCRYATEDATAMKRSKAEAKGYAPCKVCDAGQ